MVKIAKLMSFRPKRSGVEKSHPCKIRCDRHFEYIKIKSNIDLIK